MKRNFDAPEPKPDSSNHINGSHLSSIFNPLVPNTGLFQNMFTDVSAFNQHLINNLTTSLFLEQQNVWSKLIADLGLGSSLMSHSLSDSNAKPCEAKKAKNSFSVNDIIQQPNGSPLNLSKSKNGVNSLTSLSKKSPEPAQNNTNDVNENQIESVNKDFNLIESKLRLPLKFGFRRETIVRELTSNGVKGDIIYYSPCGRKLRNFQEIERYLYKNYGDQKIKNIQLTKENFTFSSKYIVGNYLLQVDDQKFLDSSINHNNIKEFNHKVLNENNIISKIAELYPDFKRGSNENYDSVPSEQEFHSNNLNDFKMSPHDSKQKEKYLQREKKARLRWFSYMISKYTDKRINSDCANYEAFSKTNHAQIDDMQQNFLPNLPEYSSLNTILGQKNLSWLADTLQTIEFVANFGTTLLESFAGSHEHHTDFSILTSLKNFYQALKNFKYKKELNELVQIMLKNLLDEQTADTSDEFDNDQDYLVGQIRAFDMTEWTFSEILRLYFVKCLKNLKSHRDSCSFDIDITSDLEQKLRLFVHELESSHFDMLKIETKAAILAHLTDDLLQNSSFLQSSSLDQESRRPNAISESVEETLDKLNKLRQDKIQINHKIRHSPQLDEKMHQQKQIAQEEISSLQKQLRSGQFLGQDRFRRLYWKLNSFKPIIVQSYYQGNLQDRNCLSREVSDVVNDLVDQVESNLENEKIVKKFSHLIELKQEPFDLKIKSDQAEFLSLNFSDIEILVRNIFFNLNGEKCTQGHLSNQHGSSDKWWIFDQNCSDILNSLSSHGFREKILVKNLAQLDQIGSDENFSENLDFNQVKQMRNDKVKVLKQIISLENKVYSANLQLAQSGQDQVNCDSESSDESQVIKCARERLLKLEQSIDKRYLRYPFSFKKKLGNYKLKISNEIDQVLLEKVEQNMACSKINMSIKLNQDIRTYMKKIDAYRKEDNCMNVTNELLRWRRLVSNSKTSSQIAIFLNELNKYIEWDKSIMKASCHICSMDDNEESLLLCDNCDLGYHTYCFRPRIERIPDGDWYCFKCISKFLGNKQMCYVCGRDSTVPNESEKQILNKCEKCLCIFHGKCMPNAKLFKTTFKWHCINCLSNKTKIVKLDDVNISECDRVPKKRGRKRKYPLTDENIATDDSKKIKNHTENDVEIPNDSVKKISLCERLTLKKIKQQNESDMHKCRILLNELIRNKYSSYFMVKVSEREYPDYYEIIKEPIDFKTIKEKLKGKMYENKERFAYDCRLIFDNCECFNEDDSQIGQAGHKLRAFFETKWLKLFD